MESLDSLEHAVDKARPAVEKPEPDDVVIEECQQWKSGNREQLAFQPAPSLGLGTEQRRGRIVRLPLVIGSRLPLRYSLCLAMNRYSELKFS